MGGGAAWLTAGWPTEEGRIWLSAWGTLASRLAQKETRNTVWMIEFLFPIPEPFCPFLVQMAQMGLILPRWGLISSFSAQNTTPIPCSLLSSHTLLSGICMYTKHPNPTPNTPFSGLNLKVGKMNYSLGKRRLIWAICTKSRQKIQKWAKNNYPCGWTPLEMLVHVVSLASGARHQCKIVV